MGALNFVEFYGDVGPRRGELLMALEYDDHITACDYSEAGAHVCFGLAREGKQRKTESLELDKLLARLDPKLPVRAYGVDRWAVEIKEKGIKTVGDLKRVIKT